MSEMLPKALPYRPEIDGLRALAVLAVVAYHADLPGFTGGYLGVDAFFVISGYLITGLILAEQKAGQFSPGRFFARRIRRLVPAQIAVLLFATAAAACLYMPYALENFAESLAASTFSVANWYFAAKTGYFQPASDLQLLLHLWSLGVEEQFYLGLVLCLLLLKYRPRYIIATFAILALASFAYSSAREAGPAFFDTGARAWELLAGSLLAVLPALPLSPLRALAVRLTGLCVLLACFVSEPLGHHPGIGTLPVVLASVAIIAAGREPVRLPLLSNALLGTIGRLSYSIYLWHWPMLVLMRVVVPAPGPLHTAIALAIGLVAAVLSFYLVEAPLRHGTRLQTNRRAFSLAGTAAAAFLSVTVITVLSHGMPQRFPTEIRPLAETARPIDGSAECARQAPFVALHSCTFGSEEVPDLLIFGDSHALNMARTLKDADARAGQTISITGVAGCPPIPGVVLPGGPAYREGCAALQSALAREMARAEGPPILLVARWSYFVPSSFVNPRVVARDARAPETQLSADAANALLRHTSQALDGIAHQSGRSVTLLAQPPQHRLPPTRAIRALWWSSGDQTVAEKLDASNARYGTSRSAHDRINGQTAHLFSGLQAIQILDPTEIFCNQQNCEIVTPEAILYSDENHLSAAGVARLLPLILPR